MLSSQEEQAERRRVMAQDASLREQGGTFHQHAQADADTPRGRFSAVSNAYVVGSTAVPQYPAASGPFQRDPVPNEEPLGYAIDAVEPSTVVTDVEAHGDLSPAAPSTLPSGDVQRDGRSPPSGNSVLTASGSSFRVARRSDRVAAPYRRY
jgi:hypothetical protein